MEFTELDGNQRRHLINAQQVYTAWMRARHDKSHHGGMHWKKAENGRDYLYSTNGARQKSLGPRSPELEQTYAQHHARASALDDRLKTLDAELTRFAPVNKAYRLARVPTTAGRLLRRLAETPRIANALLVVGTNALYAYEARAAVHFSNPLVATEDLDLLWNARRQLTLTLPEGLGHGVFALLKSIDRSFERILPFRAENKQGYLVDVIRPEDADEMYRANPRLSADADELEPAPIAGLQWLVNAPRLSEIAIAEDGIPVPITTIDPRVFALHKLWLSRRPGRHRVKAPRDEAQARAVAIVAQKWLALAFTDPALSALPPELMDGVTALEAVHP